MKLDILYDPAKMKSLKIYPKKERDRLCDILSNEHIKTLKALNAAEKEVKHLMKVTNSRVKKLHLMVEENVKSGHHLQEEPFIPEYLGFDHLVAMEGPQDVRIFSKDGYNITHKNDKWIILQADGTQNTLEIKSMYHAVIILQACGMDLSFKDYMDGKYTSEKPLEEIINDVATEVAAKRLTDGDIK